MVTLKRSNLEANHPTQEVFAMTMRLETILIIGTAIALATAVAAFEFRPRVHVLNERMPMHANEYK